MKTAGCTILLVALCLTGCEPLPVRPEPQPPPVAAPVGSIDMSSMDLLNV